MIDPAEEEDRTEAYFIGFMTLLLTLLLLGWLGWVVRGG